MDFSVTNIFFGFLTSFLVAYLLIPKIIQFSQEKKLYDYPGMRASHKKNVPIFGGIGIFVGVLFAILFWGKGGEDIMNNNNLQYDQYYLQSIIAGLIVVAIVGIIDDLLSLTPFRKMVGQSVSIAIIIFIADIQIISMHGVWGINVLPYGVSILFTLFTIVVVTNAYNLIDGIDGLAASIGIIASICFGLLALISGRLQMSMLAFSLTGALLAYLKYNVFPARIFMGDTGSLVVGFILSILAIDIVRTGILFNYDYLEFNFPNKGPLIAIAVLAIPLFDSLRVFIVRLIQGKSPLYPDRNHIHHVLLDLGFSQKKSVIIILLFSLLIMLISVFLLPLNINYSIGILAIFVYGVMSIPLISLRNKKKIDE